jgi:hypothetical protein
LSFSLSPSLSLPALCYYPFFWSVSTSRFPPSASPIYPLSLPIVSHIYPLSLPTVSPIKHTQNTSR